MAANGANGNGDNIGTGKEEINYDIITLTRHLTEEQTKHKEATGDFTYGSPEWTPVQPNSLLADSCAMLSNSRLNRLPTTSGGQP